MAEFVKHRDCVVPRDQYGLARLAFNEVRVVRDDRRDLAVKAALFAVVIHPRSRALAVAGVRVEVPQADVLARGFVFYLPNGHVGVEHRNTGHGSKSKVEHLTRDPEHRVAYLVELKVRLYLVLIEVIAGLADLFSVK